MDDWDAGYDLGYEDGLAEQDAAIDRLTAENAKLRAALAPFALQADIIDQPEPHGSAVEDRILFRLYASYTGISVGDCRRAKEALG